MPPERICHLVRTLNPLDAFRLEIGEGREILICFRKKQISIYAPESVKIVRVGAKDCPNDTEATTGPQPRITRKP